MKDFITWCKKKQNVEVRNIKYPKRREIWWVDLGVNIGSEQDGVGHLFERPVLVLKTFANATCLVAPLSRTKSENKFIFDLDPYGYRSKVLISQLKTISTKRFSRVIERLDSNTFEEVLHSASVRNGLFVMSSTVDKASP